MAIIEPLKGSKVIIRWIENTFFIFYYFTIHDCYYYDVQDITDRLQVIVACLSSDMISNGLMHVYVIVRA